MSIWLKRNMAHLYDMVFCFANTSEEDEDTLRFVNEVDKRYDLNVIWLETVTNLGRSSSTHKVVTYETASRKGECFDSMCQKYGLPNMTFKMCTRELKLNPMRSYLRSIGWKKGSYKSAVGIRKDEMRRVSNSADVQDIIYPLIDMIPTDKDDVLAFFEDFEWDLKIPEHMGNCKTCFKKSERKLGLVYKENPAAFDTVIRLDTLYKNVGPNNVPGPRKMYRGYRTPVELIADISSVDPAQLRASDGGCSESCELYETDPS